MKKTSDKKQKIIDVAFELFIQTSYETTSFNQICERAKVSKGAIFHYFDSKYNLGKEVLFTKFDEHLMNPLREIKAINEHDNRLMKIIELLVDFSFTYPRFISLLLEIFNNVIENDAERQDWLNYYSDFLKSIEDEFSRIKIQNPRMKSMLLIGCLDNAAMMSSQIPSIKEPDSIDLLKKELYEIFVGNFLT